MMIQLLMSWNETGFWKLGVTTPTPHLPLKIQESIFEFFSEGLNNGPKLKDMSIA